MNSIFPIEALKAQKELAKKWAKEYFNTEEGKREMEKWEKEAIEYMTLGKPTSCLNEKLLDEIKNYGKK
jgi:hypothetical protein